MRRAHAGDAARLNLAALGKGFVLPLLLSPVLAIVVAGVLYIIFHALRVATGTTKEWCICVGTEERVVAMPQPSSVLALRSKTSTITVSVDAQENCRERYAGSFFGIGSQQIMDAAHFFSAGTVSFARGLNDTPKIVALLLLGKTLDIRWGFAAVAATMAIGGLLNARKVAETMSKKITTMNHGQGFSANLTTSILVVFASLFGLPVSTTHVSVGALFGIGLTTGKANYPMVSACTTFGHLLLTLQPCCPVNLAAVILCTWGIRDESTMLQRGSSLDPYDAAPWLN